MYLSHTYLDTAKDALNVLSQFFNSTQISSTEKKDLWDILSALRGPDTGTGKSASTVPIRVLVLGAAYASTVSGSSAVADAPALPAEQPGYNHWSRHINSAIAALKRQGYIAAPAPAPAAPAATVSPLHFYT